MNKETLKVITVNVILLFIILIVCEIFAYRYNRMMVPLNYPLPYFWGRKEAISFLDKPVHFKYYDEDYKTTKKPVLLLGCSYAMGETLADEDAPNAQLQRITNRWVYNHARGAADPMFNLLVMEKETDEPTMNRHKPEYVIYVYMFHQLQRLLEWKYFNLYRQHGFIDNQKYNFLYNLHSYTFYKNRMLERELRTDEDFSKHLDLFYKVMKDLKKQTDTLYPESKFVVLIYDDINYDLVPNLWRTVDFREDTMQKLFDIMYSPEFKKGLEDLGIEVITTEELLGRKMDRLEDRAPNDMNHPHPSKEAWAEILPKLAKKLNL